MERFDTIVIGGGELGAPKQVLAAGLAASRRRRAFGLFPAAFAANCRSAVTLAEAHAELLAPMIAEGALDSSLDPSSARRFDVPAAV